MIDSTHPLTRGGLLLCLVCVMSVAQVRGERADAFEFLRLPAGARTSALGGAGVADALGWEGSQLNPAGLGQLKRDEVSFSGSRWMKDVSHQSVGYAHPFFAGGAISGSFTNLTYGEIASYSPSGAHEGSTDAQDMAARVGYGRSWRNQFCWGAQGVYARQDLAGVTAHALAADGGVLWSPVPSGPLRSLTVGGAFHNWGQGPRYGNNKETLPQNFQAGVNVRPFFEGASVSIDGLFSPQKPTVLLVGAEYWARGAVALRLGYNGRKTKEGSGLTLGLGFRAWDVEVNYSFVGEGDLGETHQVGVTYRFGGWSEKHYRQGMVSLQNKDYAQAVVHFARSISIDPKNRRAIENLREANLLLQSQSDKKPR